MSVVDKTEAHRRIINAARTEFATHGLAGARIERIVAAAPASKERLYAYFGDKNALFAAVLDDGFASFRQHVPFDANDLGGYAANFYRHVATHPEAHRVLLWAQLEDGGSFIAAHGAAQADVVANLAAIEAAQRAGTLPTAHTAPDTIAIIFGVVSSWINVSGPAWAEVVDGDEIDRRSGLVETVIKDLFHPKAP